MTDLWQRADKVVYSNTFTEARTKRTRIERDFDAGAVESLKERAERDLTVAEPGLAAHALRAGLVGECHLLLVP